MDTYNGNLDLESTGCEDQTIIFLIHDSFLTQHVLEPTMERVYQI